MFTGKCLKASFIRLYDEAGKYVGTERTMCKTWNCQRCSLALKSLFKKRVRHGSMAGPSYFITVTLRLAKNETASADSANRVLTVLLRRLKSRYPSLYYVKVPELTKKNQPHFHLMAGGFGVPTKDCCGRKMKGRHVHTYSKAWARQTCECLEHQIANIWLETTNDSYRVQVDAVYNARGAGAYMAKYFTKTFEEHRSLDDAGFSRRFAFSRNFPKLDKLQMAATKEDRWGHVEIIDRKAPDFYWQRMYYLEEVRRFATNRPDMMVQVGEEYLKREKIQETGRKVVRLLNANIPS